MGGMLSLYPFINTSSGSLEISDYMNTPCKISVPLLLFAGFFQTLTGTVSTTDVGTVQISEREQAADQVQLQWQSSTGKAYRIYQSENLDSSFLVQTQSMEATPPSNIWWIDKGNYQKRFFMVEAYTESAPAVIPLNSNHDFTTGLNDWITSVNTVYADATFDTSNGDLFVNITNGGTNTSHIFLRQFNIPLIQGQTYTLLFDARVTATRSIRVTLRDGDSAPNFLASDVTLSNVNAMQTYRMTFTMTGADTSNGRLSFLLGNDDNSLYLDNIRILAGAEEILRSAAHRMNTRLFRGNNFMASKAMNSQGAPEDYALLNTSGFSHCRIGYKMDERAGSSPTYTLPQSDLDELQNMVDWCLQEGLIAVVDPVHNWANNSDPTEEFTGSDDDFNRLQKIWEQVADRFANYNLDDVVFEVFNEPHSGHDVARIITTSLTAIRASTGNESRIVIVPGDGFSTRQALIDAFNNDEIPSDDPYLIGTFHYYDPFTFTKQGAGLPDWSPDISWGTEAEFAQVATDFDAVATANNNWASRNHTEPLPIYLGEFGVDNEADDWNNDRKKWLSWIRMQAEKRDFSWAHWNMYQNQNSSKGMGPWIFSEQIQNPEQRSFDADPLEALIGHYEFEDGTRGGGVSVATDEPGYKGTGYASFPIGAGTGIWARAESIYIPKNDTYAVKIHYASGSDRLLRLVSRNDSLGTVETLSDQLFPATGGDDSWSTLTVNVSFEAGEEADLKIVAFPDTGVNLDWVRICLP